MGTLYIISTPIGNLQDITIRAIQTLFSVDYILTEDVQKTRFMMLELKKRYPFIRSDLDIRSDLPKIELFNEFKENENVYQYLALLEKGNDVALTSEAGTPLVSDPGYKLVVKSIKKGIKVESIPGPSAVIASLVISGLPTDKFLFLGFLPRTAGKRRKLLINTYETLKYIHPTVILFESPHRLIGTLRELKEIFGDIEIVIGRELTKQFEQILRGKLSHIISRYEKREIKGEITLLFSLRQKSYGD